MRTVRTKAELEAAVEAGADEIQVEGELAKAVHERRATRKKLKLGAALLALGGVVAAPLTGGTSLVLTGPAAGTYVAVALGAGLLLAIKEGYEEIEFRVGPDGVTLRLRKKARK